MIELSLDDVTEWIRERLPAAFTARVIDQIVEKLEKDGVYSRNPSAGGAWSGTNFYAKEVPKDQKVIQAANAALLNGLAEKVSPLFMSSLTNNNHVFLTPGFIDSEGRISRRPGVATGSPGAQMGCLSEHPYRIVTQTRHCPRLG